MTALKNATSLTLKLQLETAILKSRQDSFLQQTKVLLGQEATDKALRPGMTWEEAYEEDIRIYTAKRFNKVLKSHFFYGESLSLNNQTANWNNQQQTVAAFMYAYFKDNEEAIDCLENLSPSAIYRVNAQNRKIIIDERPRETSSTKAFQGLKSPRADDLWHDDENEPINISFAELEAGQWLNDNPHPTKRVRTSSPVPEAVTINVTQPPEDFLATEQYWEGYSRGLFSRSPGSADPSLKRKDPSY
jgi:hypothetical protein